MECPFFLFFKTISFFFGNFIVRGYFTDDDHHFRLGETIMSDTVTNYKGSLQELLQAGMVSLVSIPVEDDLSDWDDLYHIRAIPSVYLLDEDKTVIYKDCTIERLLAFLENEYR